MTCEITGRPCCMGNEAKCKIVSKDECDFHNGTYHENKTLCSQVSGLSVANVKCSEFIDLE